MTAPKITLVIPTRERLPALRHCVQTARIQDYKNFQILVSDNASTDGTGDFIQGLDDPRVRYVNTGRRVSMSSNWEFALSHVDDGWVMFLGDDDGLLPGAISRLAEIIETTDCEAITFRACHYIWPGLSGSHFGRLVIPFCGGQEVRRTSDWLKRVADSQADYTNLPMIYICGIVSMRLINRIPRQCGRFFNSSIPDVYACIAIARSITSHIYVNQPFTIVGSSKFSNGFSFAATPVKAVGDGEYRRIDSGNAAEYLRFMSENDIPPHPGIAPLRGGGHPLSWQMFIYEAFLQSKYIGGNVQDPPPAKQLALALAHPYAPKHSDPLNGEWGRGFACLHGIDFGAAWSEAKSLRRRAKVGSMVRRIRSAIESLVIFDRSVPLENVYTASLVAAAALWAHPPVGTRLLRNGHYALKRMAPSLRR
jgi:glycosyltransferase involved in cell wall biosynthesis